VHPRAVSGELEGDSVGALRSMSRCNCTVTRVFGLPCSRRPMRIVMRHSERHRTHRTGWLRAAVLGANDGIVSTASPIVGVAAAGTGVSGILVAGIAGLVGGAMSMAAGEYVSVSSQADTERADLARERQELAATPEQEQAELAAIYVKRGLQAELAFEAVKDF